MSILYLEIFNLETQKTIGNYEHPELKNSSLKKEIEDKCKELIPQIKTEAKTLKKHINFKNDSKKSLEIYYLLQTVELFIWFLLNYLNKIPKPSKIVI